MNLCTAVASEQMAMQPAIARQNGRGVWLNNQLPATASQISSLERQTPFFASCFHYLTKATFCWFLWVYRNKMTSFAGRSRKARGPDVARGQYNAQVWSTVNADSKCMPWYISGHTDVLQVLALFLKNGFSHHYKRCNIQCSQSKRVLRCIHGTGQIVSIQT